MVVLVCLQTLCVVLYLRPDSRKMIVKQFPRHPVNLQVSDMDKRGSGEGEKERRRREEQTTKRDKTGGLPQPVYSAVYVVWYVLRWHGQCVAWAVWCEGESKPLCPPTKSALLT